MAAGGAPADGHQAGVAACGRGVDAQRALHQQPLQRHGRFAVLQADHADDGAIAPGHFATHLAQMVAVTVVQHRGERGLRVAPVADAADAPAQRLRQAAVQGVARFAGRPQGLAADGQDRRRPVSRSPSSAARHSTPSHHRCRRCRLDLAGRAAQGPGLAAGRACLEIPAARTQAGVRLRFGPGAQFGQVLADALAQAFVHAGLLRAHRAQRVVHGRAPLGQQAQRVQRAAGLRAGARPGRAAEGCTPTTAPTMLRLT